MYRMWQGVLSVAYPSCAQDTAPGGVTAQVSSMQAQLQPAQQSQDASTHAHRSQAVRVLLVQQGVSTELRPPPAHAHARGRRRARRRCVGHRRGRVLVVSVTRGCGRGRTPIGCRRRRLLRRRRRRG